MSNSSPPLANAGAVDFLLRRMQRSRDFPALAETVRALNGFSASNNKSTGQLATLIVRDFALTNKILKVVNSAYYASFSGKVGTISRATVVLGIEPVRALAASLILFEQLSNENNVERVRTLIGKSMFSALLARDLAKAAGFAQAEEAFLAAMFHNLGELLVAFYLPEEDAAIQAELADAETTAAEAQHKVLGLDFAHLGIAIGKNWNFPQAITHSMKALPRKVLDAPVNEEERLRQLAAFAQELTEQLAAGEGQDSDALKEVRERYANCARLDDQLFLELIKDTRSEYRFMANGLATSKQAPPEIRTLSRSGPVTGGSGQVLDGVDGVIDDASEGQTVEPDSVAAALAASILPGETERPADQVPLDPGPVLVDGLQESTTMLAEGANANQVAEVVLETLYRAFGLRRVALCLRIPARHEYLGRIGFGDDADSFVRALRFAEAYTPDAFHVALKQRTDLYIADLGAGVARGIPPWYARLSPNGSLLFMPLVVQEVAIGCILADHARSGGMQLEPAVLRLVRALRNQLALAIQLRR